MQRGSERARCCTSPSQRLPLPLLHRPFIAACLRLRVHLATKRSPSQEPARPEESKRAHSFLAAIDRRVTSPIHPNYSAIPAVLPVGSHPSAAHSLATLSPAQPASPREPRSDSPFLFLTGEQHTHIHTREHSIAENDILEISEARSRRICQHIAFPHQPAKATRAATAAAKHGLVAHVRRHPPGSQQGRRTESARGCPPVLCQLGEYRACW